MPTGLVNGQRTALEQFHHVRTRYVQHVRRPLDRELGMNGHHRDRIAVGRDFALAGQRGLPNGRRVHASTFKPCFSTTASSFSAIPLGRLVPASHFCTVDSLVFRYRAKIG